MNSNNYLDYLWKEVNSKKCPKCAADIQKDSGCMKMTCTCCDHKFCWLCLKEWEQHSDKTGGFYVCNMFKEDKEKNKELNNKEKKLKQLEFYADRFFEHRKSHEEAIRKRTVILRLFGKYVAGQEPQLGYLENALDLIVESRRAISNTYGQAYFLSEEAK